MRDWQARDGSHAITDPWRVGLVLLVMVALIGLLTGCASHQVGTVTVDPVRRRVVIPETVPGSFDVCDGPTGACFALSNLRRATAAIRGGR